MTATKDKDGKMNNWATEPVMYYENYDQLTPNQVKERYNGLWAIIGVVSGLISYGITGKLFFGVF